MKDLSVLKNDLIKKKALFNQYRTANGPISKKDILLKDEKEDSISLDDAPFIDEEDSISFISNELSNTKNYIVKKMKDILRKK